MSSLDTNLYDINDVINNKTKYLYIKNCSYYEVWGVLNTETLDFAFGLYIEDLNKRPFLNKPHNMFQPSEWNWTKYNPSSNHKQYAKQYKFKKDLEKLLK